jgi:hypothetical protein
LYWNASAIPAAWNVGSTNITLGQNAGQTGQGNNAVALGQEAGQTNQGDNAVAIGYRAGNTGQRANSIVINASGSALNTGTTGTCFVAPIRNPNTTSYDNFLNYDASSNEVVYNYFMMPVGGTTGRPSPAVTGMMRYNTTTGFPEFYNGTNWLSFSVGTQATLTVSGISSSISYVNAMNGIIASPIQGGYTIYVFNSVGTGSVVPNFTGNVEYLVIGGGGGGGSGNSSSFGGGGGAGGYRTNYGGTGFPVSSVNTYTVTVGNQGLFQSADNTNGTPGSSSTFSTISSSGGGYGAGSGGNIGGPGGSGGGGAYTSGVSGTVGGTGNAGGYSPVEGYNGGNYNTGGQGAPGGSASSAGSTGQAPTTGASNTITGGSAIIYAYGGGGNPTESIYTTAGSGGNGGRVSQPGNNGIIGIVVIRFPSYF